MNTANVQLESFDQIPFQGHQPILSENALHEAYVRGHKDGADETKNMALYTALEDIRCMSTHLQKAKSEADKENQVLITQALTPLVDSLLEHVAPIGMRQKLSQFISEELTRISTSPSGSNAIIKCSPQLTKEIMQIIESSGVSNVRVETCLYATQGIELIIGESTTTFNPDQFMSDLQALINNINRSVAE